MCGIIHSVWICLQTWPNVLSAMVYGMENNVVMCHLLSVHKLYIYIYFKLPANNGSIENVLVPAKFIFMKVWSTIINQYVALFMACDAISIVRTCKAIKILEKEHDIKLHASVIVKLVKEIFLIQLTSSKLILYI